MTDSADAAERRLADGTSWAEFCDALKRAGDVVLESTSPLDRAEGYRYLTRLLRAGLETCIEHAHPEAPTLLRTCHETVKMGADNPDNLYQNASINGKYEYRLRGKRGSVHYLGFGTFAGGYGGSGDMPPTAYLDDTQIEFDAEGRFELVLSKKPHPKNWLALGDDTRVVVVRQTFLDRKNETPALLELSRSDGAHVPGPLTPRSMDRGLRNAALFVAGCSQLFAGWVRDFQKHPNTLPRFDSKVADAVGGVPHIVYYHGFFSLEQGQALVIEVTPPDCDYWNFQANNIWMESLDYRYFQVTVNKHTARYRSDGSVRIVVSAVDPGVDNWIDTCGHERGTLCLRWVRAKEHPNPSTRVVTLDELCREGSGHAAR